MANRNPLLSIVDYYSKPLSLDRIVYLNTLNSVEQEKVELYKDFIISLTYLISDTYMGDDVMTDEEHYKGHFNWCWRKNVSNFSAESLIFDELGEHYYYFYKYFYDVYYMRDVKNHHSNQKIISFWEEIMSMDKLKTNGEYDLFINLYKIQTKHFRNNFA